MNVYRLKNGEEFLVREAAPEDAEPLLEFMNRVGGESDNLLFGKNEAALTPEQQLVFLQQMRENPNAAMFVGLLGDEIVCSAQCGRKGLRSRIMHRGAVAVTVSKSQWGKGIGSCMLEHLLAYARQLGLEILELEVREDNAAAIGLYRKMGFVEIGKYARFFKYGTDCYADALMMQCML